MQVRAAAGTYATDHPSDGSALQAYATGVLSNAVRDIYAPSNSTPGGFSYHLQFVLDYLAESSSHTMVIVNGNDGASGFSSNNWNPGDNRYEYLLTRTLGTRFLAALQSRQ